MSPSPRRRLPPPIKLAELEEHMRGIARDATAGARLVMGAAIRLDDLLKSLGVEHDHGRELIENRALIRVQPAPPGATSSSDDDGSIGAWLPPKSSTSSSSQASAPPSSSELDGAAAALMNVLACKHPAPIGRRELAHRAVYAPKSRHLGNVISSMRVAKFVEDAGDRELVATDDGLQSHGAITPLLNARQLVDAWRARKLSGGAGTILQILSVAKGGRLKKSEIAERSGYARTSRHFGNLLSELRSAEIVEGKSVFQLAPWFVVVGGES